MHTTLRMLPNRGFPAGTANPQFVTRSNRVHGGDHRGGRRDAVRVEEPDRRRAARGRHAVQRFARGVQVGREPLYEPRAGRECDDADARCRRHGAQKRRRRRARRVGSRRCNVARPHRPGRLDAKNDGPVFYWDAGEQMRPGVYRAEHPAELLRGCREKPMGELYVGALGEIVRRSGREVSPAFERDDSVQ